MLALLLAATTGQAQTKPADLLLIGTFHFDNPGLDVSKINTLDVLAPKVQTELETISSRIAAFQPDKIFVEWSADDQKGLDDLYAAYLGPDYAGYVKTKFPKQAGGFYARNEIIQLAFRAARKAKLPRVYAMDYRNTQFPYDSVMHAMQSARQEALLQQVQAYVKSYEENMNRKLATYSLTQLLLDENTQATLDSNKGFYLDKVNRAGTASNFNGPFLVSEWYRRNLYMYSIIQKTVAPTDDKVVVLVGSGHAAMMREFLSFDSRFRLKELKDVLKK
ncbi:hypothetical protein HNQ93_000815 [Hymenobacter luteus]|uniref:TraB/GumN family protein n=2 Tax=Hymenobacter TaxID=89966 RepID=A0A7W9SY06_9BACT|nr:MULTISPECIES: DUF5694 domain-containing protein [Hymenobacter]MBB4599705.1 hypothetical protein [Hymenobacter latericoloratus]MBB6057985.1 hypothetical protein [Hymenobacter luteus]